MFTHGMQLLLFKFGLRSVSNLKLGALCSPFDDVIYGNFFSHSTCPNSGVCNLVYIWTLRKKSIANFSYIYIFYSKENLFSFVFSFSKQRADAMQYSSMKSQT